MSEFSDTGRNAPESVATLKEQQKRLIDRWRAAQMFPRGTRELGLPEGMRRLETPRGVFHFNPELITEEEILRVSAEERENEILELGPFNKREILARVERGERLMLISEYTMKGVEVRSAVGTEKTIEEQHSYFERTKGEEGFIVMGVVPERVMKGLKEIENG